MVDFDYTVIFEKSISVVVLAYFMWQNNSALKELKGSINDMREVITQCKK